MASGSVRSGRYAKECGTGISFSKSFSANATTLISPEQADYPDVPNDYIAIIAGAHRNNSALLPYFMNANPVGEQNLIGVRNISSSAQNNHTCYFRYTYVRAEMIKDERGT